MQPPSPCQIELAPPGQLEDAIADLHALGRRWVEACISRYADAPATDVHDQGTYTTAWDPLIRNDAELAWKALPFLRRRRDVIRDRHVDAGEWRHGYWRMQEAHHGTEHFELFLAALWRLDPTDGDTVGQFLDMAEHLGNFSDAVPPWFDWDRGLYRSMYFGADGVQTDAGKTVNTPDHFRCVNLAELAYRMSDDPAYLRLAATHAGVWAEAILAEATAPVGIDAEGPIYRMTEQQYRTYRGFAGMSGDQDQPLDRAENFLASDAPASLLRLWRHTDEASLRDAARHLLDAMIPALPDPDAGALAHACWVYRQQTGDTRYDDAIRAATPVADLDGTQTIGLDPDPPSRGGRATGIGKRYDTPHWQENGQPRRFNPVTLAVRACLDDDRALAERATRIGQALLSLAIAHYPDGREHGCCAQSVSAIARGHGRENHVGVLTGVYDVLQQHFGVEPAPLPV